MIQYTSMETIGNSMGTLTKNIVGDFGYPWGNRNMGNVISTTGEYIGSSIKSTGDFAGNCIEIVGDLVGNEIKQSSRVYGVITQNVINNNTIKGVVTAGFSGGIGAGGKLAGSTQFAFDTRGNTQAQLSGGAGISTGEGLGMTGVIAIYPGLEDVSATEGFSTVAGVSAGLGWFGGIDIILSGEGNDIHPVGIAIMIGGGEGLEGHIYMTETIGAKPFNIYDAIYDRPKSNMCE